MHAPTIIEQPTAEAREAARAQFWRKNVAKMTRIELGKALGYSAQAIQLFERGYDYKGRPLGRRAWTRYRLACAGLGVKNFTWGTDE